MSTKSDAYLTVISHLEAAAKLLRMAGIELGQDPDEPEEGRIAGKPDPDGLLARTEELYQLLTAEIESVRGLLPKTAVKVLERRDAGVAAIMAARAEMTPEQLRAEGV